MSGEKTSPASSANASQSGEGDDEDDDDIDHDEGGGGGGSDVGEGGGGLVASEVTPARPAQTPSGSPILSDEEYEEYLPDAVEEYATIFGLSQSASPVSSAESLVVSPVVETASTPPPERAEPFAYTWGGVLAGWNTNDDHRFEAEAEEKWRVEKNAGGSDGRIGGNNVTMTLVFTDGICCWSLSLLESVAVVVVVIVVGVCCWNMLLLLLEYVVNAVVGVCCYC